MMKHAIFLTFLDKLLSFFLNNFGICQHLLSDHNYENKSMGM